MAHFIPGLAIATALIPPLYTCGYSIANAQWKLPGGAAYLFISNTYFIAQVQKCAGIVLFELGGKMT